MQDFWHIYELAIAAFMQITLSPIRGAFDPVALCEILA